ncbi:DNA recombination protein RmuC [Thiomicrospira aerophila AL3]|uniref:DNA recombination protein RmuC n=1 Tax=Thiomicrospira aerophila AL3 TaxID=717772 RepID=W0DSV8_9GAMM|nr:DNA recombination protein RmuC [Thiomicrospira aerophila]AHF00358.1 DNA recombination protein RmuC [Thiomicrospira aerophila AL3]
MMIDTFILISSGLLLGLLLAGLLVWRKQVKQNQAQLTELHSYQQRFQQLSEDYRALESRYDAAQQHFAQEREHFSNTKAALTHEFENLAQRIFEQQGQQFSQQNQTQISQLLQPFREQVSSFQQRVNEVHDAATRGQAGLQAELRKVIELGMSMSQEAHNLTRALKGDAQQRGAWGEAQLRRTLEMSGLIESVHFSVQDSFKDAQHRDKRTDFVIRLPDAKHIILDSKVSLVAYDRWVATESESPAAQQAALDAHCQAVRRHIQELAAKDYTQLIGVKSPSFVLLFMPIEPAYIAALKAQPGLFDEAYNQGVVLVSHTTLLPILRTITNLWTLAQSQNEAQALGEKAGEIYQQVSVIAERLTKLGTSLSAASNHYNSTVTALAGNQGLYGKVARFNQLSTKVQKSLPTLETKHIDFDTERLSMLIDPLNTDLDKTSEKIN